MRNDPNIWKYLGIKPDFCQGSVEHHAFEAVFEFVWCIEQHIDDHTATDQFGSAINKKAVETCGYWVCAYGACPSLRVATRRG